MKRKLTEQERLVSLGSIKQLEDRLKVLAFYKKYYSLMLDEGLDMQFLEKRQDFNHKNRETQKEEEETNLIIKELKKQLLEGVEIKDGKHKN